MLSASCSSMPRPPETPDVRASKTLAYILRHGAEKEQLQIRSDGYLKLSDVLARPKMKEVDLATVLRLVEENAKQRFELFYGYDPSPPKPKGKGKGSKGGGKGKGQGKALPPSMEGHQMEVDAAAVDDLRQSMTSTTISKSVDPTSSPKASAPISTELPLVSFPIPRHLEEDGSTASTSIKGEYFIRATQGHSINLESTAHLEPVLDDEDGRRRVGEMVHGTRWELWDVLKTEGLSKMARQHIHLAPSLKGKITPRPNSTLLIYLSLPSLLSPPPPTAPIPVYTSLNGVVLTPGNENGMVPPSMFARAVRIVKGKRVIVWADGAEIEREDGDAEVIGGPATSTEPQEGTLAVQDAEPEVV